MQTGRLRERWRESERGSTVGGYIYAHRRIGTKSAPVVSSIFSHDALSLGASSEQASIVQTATRARLGETTRLENDVRTCENRTERIPNVFPTGGRCVCSTSRDAHKCKDGSNVRPTLLCW